MTKRAGLYVWTEYGMDRQTALRTAFSEGYWAANYNCERNGGQYSLEEKPTQYYSWLAGFDSFSSFSSLDNTTSQKGAQDADCNTRK